ncbi:tRNA guanosine(34) transglycosylase Tgt [Azospirillum sp. RWY-5-1]|uniref:Queuine tRNA-ribosyltransferase n=1 Tax=Azospirillum oleiclasticum TaxID=2735135 RepID=A0ABX2TMQ2_9PROT|nr:tRNA guanosine(34) transglycosylase Tgt [Azospirillum oleiclasticum]NYZ17848.1 tRNA guanosine(34) transglycosylase Tgt [Azospirillum oleiclasticum]NYZ25056.1 tRNA guanosine(34) transglycosylase Tgt [Azospirillum oleiclasticum]
MPDHVQYGPAFGFEIKARLPDSRARLGRLSTPHGAIETPAFIFCGTKATVKGVTPAQLCEADTQIILSNTYHLMIQPGADLVASMGGLHRFMDWDGPMLTDSGGFQIFSMGHGSVADEIKGRRQQTRDQTLLKVTEEGATFRSYLDGSKLFLSPEGSIDIQRKLGADLIVQLDECTPFHADRAYTARSMRMSHRWGDRCIERFVQGEDGPMAGKQALYGIVQGGVHPDLREESTAYTRDRPFFGTAIGGSLGSHKDQMYEVVAMCAPHIHPDRPVHLLGIGGIVDVFAGVELGIDTFDCVSPTRIARHGWALAAGVPANRLNLRNARFRQDPGPLEDGCDCYTCRRFSRAYVHHLLKADELLGAQLVSIHNIAVMNRLMREIREGLAAGDLASVKARWL